MTSHPATTAGRAGLPRWFGILLLAEAATFGVASYLHRDGRIGLGFTTITGEHFPNAALPEAVIGAVLAVAGAFALAAPARARTLAAAATGFAVLGVVVGLTVVLGSTRASIGADVGYHAGILAVLLASVYLLGSGGRAMRRPAPRGDDQRASDREPMATDR
jgi:hypothetical protein